MSLQTSEIIFDDEVMLLFSDREGRQPNSVYIRWMFQLIDDCCGGSGMTWSARRWCDCLAPDDCDYAHRGIHDEYDGRSSP